MANEIKVEESIYTTLQRIRVELNKANLKKSGHNAFQNFDYYEEDDFLPTISKLCMDNGVCPIFEIKTDANDGREYAYLTLYKGTQRVTQQLPTAEPSGNNAIQVAGSKFTYMERYSYMKMFCICENDLVDSADNSKVAKAVEAKATKEQIDIITDLYDVENVVKILKYYNIEKIEDLTVKQASQVIAKKKVKNG